MAKAFVLVITRLGGQLNSYFVGKPTHLHGTLNPRGEHAVQRDGPGRPRVQNRRRRLCPCSEPGGCRSRAPPFPPRARWVRSIPREGNVSIGSLEKYTGVSVTAFDSFPASAIRTHSYSAFLLPMRTPGMFQGSIAHHGFTVFPAISIHAFSSRTRRCCFRHTYALITSGGASAIHAPGQTREVSSCGFG